MHRSLCDRHWSKFVYISFYPYKMAIVQGVESFQLLWNLWDYFASRMCCPWLATVLNGTWLFDGPENKLKNSFQIIVSTELKLYKQS